MGCRSDDSLRKWNAGWGIANQRLTRSRSPEGRVVFPEIPVLDRKPYEEPFLCMEPIAGLLKDDASIGIEHFVGNFLASPSR